LLLIEDEKARRWRVVADLALDLSAYSEEGASVDTITREEENPSN